MKKINFKQIRKLPPQEKIKVLKEVEQELQKLIIERKKEIENKNQEIEEAELLLKEAEDEFRVLEEIQKPEIKVIEVDKLFKREEGLENITEQEAKVVNAEKEQRIEQLRKAPVEDLYKQVKSLEDEMRETGIETFYQQEQIQEIGEAFYRKKQDAENQEYIPGAKAEALMTNLERTLKGLYK